MHIPLIEFSPKKFKFKCSVNDNLIDFLKRCYLNIPYRNGKSEIRNIPYIILNTSRGIEDNFITFYRFIECYYKKQKVDNIKSRFIKYSIAEHYCKKNELNTVEIEQYSQEIISLRNRYVHSGYYLRNRCLKISFKKSDMPQLDSYTINDIDGVWIYKKTKILYDIVLDIIFVKLLNYETYDYSRTF